MSWAVTIGGLLYNVVIILAVYAWIKIRAGRLHVTEDFILSGRDFPWYVCAATISLTSLGGQHINGLTAQSWSTGVATIWFCLAQGVVFTVLCRFMAPWFIRMRVVTVPDMLGRMFGPYFLALSCGCFVVAGWSSLSLETQGLAVVVHGMTQLSLAQAAIFGGIIGVLYVFLAGMKEVGWVNLVNAILMYVVCILVLICIGLYVTHQGGHGWKTINDYFLTQGQRDLLTAFGNGTIMRTYIIGTFLAIALSMNMSQANLQSALPIRSIRQLNKTLYAAIPANVLFGVIVISIGMAAKAIPEAAATGGGNTGALWIVMHTCPAWLSICVIGAFLAAILSTFAMLSLATSTIIVRDLQIPFFTKRRSMSAKQEGIWVRVWILIVSFTGVWIALGVPNIVQAMTWRITFEIPLFVMMMIGFLWKCSSGAGIVTVLFCWVLNCLLTFTGWAALVRLEGNNYSIFMLIFSLLIGVSLTAADRKAKPGMVKRYKEQKESYSRESGTLPAGECVKTL
jgi:SSS family solute:Na+ symporter